MEFQNPPLEKTLADLTFQKIMPEVDAPKGSLETQLIKASKALKWEVNINEVKRLISEGADINGRKYAKTALMEASINGHLDIVKILLNSGADINLEDWDGRTALMFPALNGHKDIVIELINKGADLNKKDNDGETALMKASQ